ncbi:MAG: hypothetical protein KDA89_10185 [Planctomycetaceae bacterium]|nr:hypothetical protein [Planctomycetaceae bacterium]
MKRFRSRVDALQRVRAQSEKLARLTAAVCQAQKLEADQRVAGMQQELEVLSRQALSGFAVDNSPVFVQTVMAAVAAGRSRLRDAGEQQTEASRRLTAAVDAVAESRRDTQVVEQFQENERQRHRQQQLTEEEHIRTEASSRRHNRKPNERR